MKDRIRPLLTLLLLVSACGGAPPLPEPTSGDSGTLVVPLAPRSGSHLSGKATFTPVTGGVRVKVEVAGVPPGKVATHVHEVGDCSAPDATSAGGHFNPAHQPHALPPGAERHLGDLGNIEVGPDGKGATEIVVPGANLREGDPSSYRGRAIIVHERQDDGSQPVGNAGGRIGCGVIGAGKAT